MEAEFKVFKEEFKLGFQKFFTGFDDHPMRLRCESVIGAVSIYKKIISHSAYRNEVITVLKRLLTNLASKLSSELEETFNQLTVQACKSVVFSLQDPNCPIEQCLNHCLSTKSPLTETLSNSILHSISLAINPNPNFLTLWKLALKNLLIKLNLITGSNTFAKNFLSLTLIGHHGNNCYTPIDSSNISFMTSTLFANAKNFKFFLKACRICHSFKSLTNPSLSATDSPCLTVTLTSVPDLSLAEFQPVEFNLTESGVASSNRQDSLVLIGSHPFCDICVPGTNTENISFAVFNNGSEFFILDPGKASHVSRKLQLDQKLRIHDGIIINLANSALIHLTKQSFEDDLNSELSYEFLTGELSQSASRIKKLVTRQKNGEVKKKFLVGRGVQGEPANICLSQDSRISGRHLYFEYENGEWLAFDPCSKNGSFVLLKNIEQYRQRRFSDPVKLMLDQELFACFMVAGCSFYFKLTNNL